TSLDRLLAQHVAKGAIEQVSGRVMPGDRLAAWSIHDGAHAIAGLEPIGWHRDAVADRLTLRLDVEDSRLLAVPGQPAGICRLTAPLGIEGRFFEEHIRLFWVTRDREDVGKSRINLELVVAVKTRRASRQRRRESAGCDPAPFPLTLHQRRDRRHVDRDALFLGQLSGEFYRKAKRIVEVEDFLGGQRLPINEPLETLHALPQRDAEALLLRTDDLGYLAGLLAGPRVDVTEYRRHDRHPGRQTPRWSEPTSMDHRAPNQAPQHVAASLVGWRDPVGHQHGGATGMVGQHLQRDIGGRVIPISLPGLFRKMPNQRLEQIRLEHA